MNSLELRRLARNMGLGRMLYWMWHRPAGALGGLLSGEERQRRRIMAENRAGMVRAAWELAPIRRWETALPCFDIHFLTGERYWHETAFCFGSLCRYSDHPLRLVLHDDGTLSREVADHIATIFPMVKVHSIEGIEARLDDALPSARYPTLREWRVRQPLLRKITDLHAGSEGWKLLLDSDMVFHRRPDHLLAWLERPTRPIYMVDIKNAYGFSHKLRHSLVQKEIHDRINIGIFGLESGGIDFDQLEFWLRKLLEYEPSPYNLTQGLTSMLLAGVECDVAPEEDYIVYPSRGESEHPTAILHHFVAESREWYGKWGWKHALRAMSEATAPAGPGKGPESDA